MKNNLYKNMCVFVYYKIVEIISNSEKYYFI